MPGIRYGHACAHGSGPFARPRARAPARHTRPPRSYTPALGAARIEAELVPELAPLFQTKGLPFQDACTQHNQPGCEADKTKTALPRGTAPRKMGAGRTLCAPSLFAVRAPLLCSATCSSTSVHAHCRTQRVRDGASCPARTPPRASARGPARTHARARPHSPPPTRSPGSGLRQRRPWRPRLNTVRGTLKKSLKGDLRCFHPSNRTPARCFTKVSRLLLRCDVGGWHG